ncbi:membrane protein [Staphylococcus aureus]|nr:membrane protein [Staphylococcus aureus]
MNKKHVFVIIGVILCICIVVTAIHFKIKYDEKENKKQYTIKNNKSALHFISSIIPRSQTQSKLYISLTLKQVLWEVL